MITKVKVTKKDQKIFDSEKFFHSLIHKEYKYTYNWLLGVKYIIKKIRLKSPKTGKRHIFKDVLIIPFNGESVLNMPSLSEKLIHFYYKEPYTNETKLGYCGLYHFLQNAQPVKDPEQIIEEKESALTEKKITSKSEKNQQINSTKDEAKIVEPKKRGRKKKTQIEKKVKVESKVKRKYTHRKESSKKIIFKEKNKQQSKKLF